MTDLRPVVGTDRDTWGTKLLAWLGVSVNTDGTLKSTAAAAALSSAVDASGVLLPAAVKTALGGSPSVLSQWLISMTQGECYELTAITRDVNEVISSATVKWYDGSAGTFTTTATDSTTGAINAYTITHTDSGKTVTQTAMTRDGGGAVTTKPALTVA